MQLTVNQTALYYQRYGKGVPVLVMHGGPGLDHSYLRPALDALGHVAELIYYDYAAHGRSEGREAVAQMSIEGLADEAEALRVALKLPKVVVLGHGFGGFVAQSFAQRHPSSIRGLILCSASAAWDYPEIMIAQAHSQASPEQMAALMACMTRPMSSDIELRKFWRQTLPLYFYRFTPDQGTALCEGIKYNAQAYNRGLFDLAPNFNATPWLGSLDVPCVVMAGAHDFMTPYTQATQRLEAHLPHVTVALFENSGHYPFVEETTAFCHTVRQYLRQLA